MPQGQQLREFEAEDFGDLPQAEDDCVEAWWRMQANKARFDAVAEGDQTGGILDDAQVEPDAKVLGSWLRNAQTQKSGHEYQYPKMPEDNTEEMNARASVFVPGGICSPGMEAKWRAAGADEQILSWIKEGGYSIKVSEEGVGHFVKNGRLAMANKEALMALVLDLLLKGSWELIQEQQLRNVLPLHLAPKPGSKTPWRLICDGRLVNEHVSPWRFQMESMKTLPVVIEKNDYMFTVDLEDAYYSAQLTEESRNLFGAQLELDEKSLELLRAAGRIPEGWAPGPDGKASIRPRGLPMGFSNSCVIFTKLARVLTKKWRLQGIRLVAYMDDILFAAQSLTEAHRIRERVLADLIELGLAPSFKKTMGMPSRRVKFLGFIVDSELMRMYVTGERLDKLEAAATILKGLAESGKKAKMREIASVAGKVISMAVAIPAARMLTRASYALIRPSEAEWDDEIQLTPELAAEMQEIIVNMRRWNRFGAPIRKELGQKQLRLITDASMYGWGFRLDGASRQWELGRDSEAAANDWVSDDVEATEQVWREMLSVERALRQLGDKVHARSILLCTDATAVVKYVNYGAGPSVVLSAIMRRVFDYCVTHGISLSAEHVAGTEMKEAAVDSLSRWDGFEVRKQVFAVFNDSLEWGRAEGMQGYTLDLYATEKSRKLHRFAARGLESESQGGPVGCVGDAFCVELQPSENVWVCPPLQILQRAVEAFMRQRVMGTVVVPDWPNQAWHLFLRRRALRSQELPRSAAKPTMFDSASGPQHAHFADKWPFRAFLVDNRNGRSMEGILAPMSLPA